MKPSLIAKRTGIAQAQIVAAVTALFPGLDAGGLAATSHDPDVQAMLRWEALAALLTALLTALPVPAQPAPAKPTKKGKPDED